MVKEHGISRGKTSFALHITSRRRQEYMGRRLRSVTPSSPVTYLTQQLALLHFSDPESVDERGGQGLTVAARHDESLLPAAFALGLLVGKVRLLQSYTSV